MYSNFVQGNHHTPLLTPDDAVRAWGGLPDLDPYVPGGGVPPKFIGGTPAEVKATLEALARDLDVDEIMIQDVMTDQQARLRSYELLAGLF
jgi:alkanesulfonate monooxygenase SsuD/methylene tetrahydromethanopterin reductase-like flavin-dependent oxidoreductase (luciferase family)